MNTFVSVVMIVLHQPNGFPVHINPETIVSMREGHQENGDKALVTDKVNCAVNTSDGKFVSVVETCDKVKELIANAKQ